MPDLVAVALPAPEFVETLTGVWRQGDAVLPVDRRLAAPARDRLLASLRPARLVDERGIHELADGQPVLDGDALVVATSGTTGKPKGVVHTHASVESSARATSAALEVDPSRDRWLACLPLAHVGGLSVVTRAMKTGTPLSVHEGFDARAVHDAGVEGATLVSLVATTLARVETSVFRRVLLGGAAPPSSVPGNVVATYGMTETGSGVVYDGVPLPGVEVRIVEEEIQLRGSMLLRAYRDGTDPRDAEGWFPTDDAGRLRPDGTLEVLGRRAELIITGGENVWPAAVEEVLAAHPSVAEVHVTGRDDPEWGQRVVARVVPASAGAPPTLDDLRSWVRERLAPWDAPRELDLVESLPRTPSGKLRR